MTGNGEGRGKDGGDLGERELSNHIPTPQADFTLFNSTIFPQNVSACDSMRKPNGSEISDKSREVLLQREVLSATIIYKGVTARSANHRKEN